MALTFKRRQFQQRSHDCTNVVAVVAQRNPDPQKWVIDNEPALQNLDRLYTVGCGETQATYYGHL